jgi:hypothetical protein
VGSCDVRYNVCWRRLKCERRRESSELSSFRIFKFQISSQREWSLNKYYLYKKCVEVQLSSNQVKTGGSISWTESRQVNNTLSLPSHQCDATLRILTLKIQDIATHIRLLVCKPCLTLKKSTFQKNEHPFCWPQRCQLF